MTPETHHLFLAFNLGAVFSVIVQLIISSARKKKKRLDVKLVSKRAPVLMTQKRYSLPMSSRRTEVNDEVIAQR